MAAHVLQRTTFCYPDSVYEPKDFGDALNMGLIQACESDDCDDLDRYIEAHMHGPIHLEQDVEALVLDPCYKGTSVEVDARKLPVRVEWHTGFRIATKALRQFADYRGKQYVELADSLAVNGWITPAIIGEAAASGQYPYDDLKKVWHYLARFSTGE